MVQYFSIAKRQFIHTETTFSLAMPEISLLCEGGSKLPVNTKRKTDHIDLNFI